MRDSLAVPMSRLQKAMFNYFPRADDFIDLGIAVEATFLRDDELNELTFRIAVRGARLLGVTPDERQKIKDLLTSIYKTRSRAVHRGDLPKRVPSPAKHSSLRDLFMDGCATTAAALREIIARGGVDWDAVLLA